MTSDTQPSAARPAPSRSRGVSIAVWLLIALYFALGVHTAVSKSVTHDELWHLPVGLCNLRFNRFDFDVLNPPLTRMWAAVPLWITDVETGETATGPQVGINFIDQYPQDFQQLYNRGRVFNLILSVATALILARWARELFGDGGALLATLLYCTSPNILAHSAIVTPDAGLMLAFLATLYSFWIWSRSRTWTLTFIMALVLGLAQGTKFTAVLLYPVLLILWFICSGTRGPDESAQRSRGKFWQMPVAFLTSLLVLSAVYQFHGSFRPLGSYRFTSSAMQSVATLLQSAPWLPLPFPEDYLVGIDEQRRIMESPHPVFLDGTWSVAGFPAYYPRTLLYKIPHPLHVCVALGLILCLIKPGGQMTRRTLVMLLLPILLLLGIAGTTAMQLGVRYVLPLLPLMILIASRLGLAWNGWPTIARRTAGALVALICFASLRHHPHHLAYFNEYAGGPVGGRNHLLDSNIDWGQDLHLVKQFMNDQQLESIGLAYFGTLPPTSLGIDYEVPPDLTGDTASTWSLPPGWYAVSVNFVMGRPHLVPHPDGTASPVDLHAFSYFQRLEPVARLGYSIDVYHVTPEQSGQLVQPLH